MEGSNEVVLLEDTEEYQLGFLEAIDWVLFHLIENNNEPVIEAIRGVFDKFECQNMGEVWSPELWEAISNIARADYDITTANRVISRWRNR